MYHESAAEVLRKTMFELMNKKSIEKIKLTEILSISRVPKTTFYRYYQDKYALMNDCYDCSIRESLQNLEFDNWDQILSDFFQFFLNNRSFLLNGFTGEGEDSLSKFIYSYTCNFYEEQMKIRKDCSSLTVEEQLAIIFNVGGSITLLEKWLKDPDLYSLSVKEVANLHYEFMPDPIKSLFPKSKES